MVRKIFRLSLSNFTAQSSVLIIYISTGNNIISIDSSTEVIIQRSEYMVEDSSSWWWRDSSSWWWRDSSSWWGIHLFGGGGIHLLGGGGFIFLVVERFIFLVVEDSSSWDTSLTYYYLLLQIFDLLIASPEDFLVLLVDHRSLFVLLLVLLPVLFLFFLFLLVLSSIVHFRVQFLLLYLILLFPVKSNVCNCSRISLLTILLRMYTLLTNCIVTALKAASKKSSSFCILIIVLISVIFKLCNFVRFT